MLHNRAEDLRERMTEEILLPPVPKTLNDSVTEDVFSGLLMAHPDVPSAPNQSGTDGSNSDQAHTVEVLMGDAMGLAIGARLRRLLTDRVTLDRIATNFVRSIHILKGFASVAKSEAKAHAGEVQEGANMAVKKIEELDASFRPMDPSLRAF